MFDFVSTIVAALIRSIIGSVGAVMTDHWLSGRSEKFHRREILAQQYLFQLQDAMEMLYGRLHNLIYRKSRRVMTDTYFEESMLYALGRVLALERIFALEAVYPQLDAIYPGLGKSLKEYRIDCEPPGSHFYRYDRLSLAEAVIEHEGDSFRTSTFLEFRRRYEAENSLEKIWLEAASKAVQSLSDEQMMEILAILKMKAKFIADKAGIDSSITNEQQKIAIPS